MSNKSTLWLILCAISGVLLLTGRFRRAFYGVDLPIVAYHNIRAGIGASDALNTTPDKLRSDLEGLKKAGYTAVFFRDIIDFYNNKATLPDKPVIITFDDGYLSNYEAAFPILKELNMKATIFVVGANIGRWIDALTGETLIPHFSGKEALEMSQSGLVDIQMHTYNLHKPAINMMEARKFLKPETYKAYLARDTFTERARISSAAHTYAYVLAYPYGLYDGVTEQAMRECGVLATVTSKAGVNRIHRAKYGLYGMKRLFPVKDSALGMINGYVSGKYKSSSA